MSNYLSVPIMYLVTMSLGVVCLNAGNKIDVLTCLIVNLQWAIVPSMGRRWTQSQDDAGGLMEKSGGAPRKHTQPPSTVSATCTVAATVQESLWNHKLWHSHHPLWHHWLPLVAAVELETSRTIPQMPSLMCKPLVLKPAILSII